MPFGRERAEVGGAGAVAVVVVAGGAGPQVVAGSEEPVAPAVVGLGAVMSSAEWGDVVAAGRPALVVGDAVVVVAAGGGAGAPGVDAGAVAFGDLLVEAVGDLPLIDPDVVVEVADRVDHDLGVGVAAPGGHLSHRDRAPGGLAAAGLLVVQVHVDHQLAGDLSERFFPVEDLAELTRLAFENRPDFRRALLDVEKSRLQLKSARDQRLPRVDAFGNFGYSSPYIANGSSDYTLGVNLTYSLFDPGRKARNEQAVEGEVLAGFERDDLANKIRLDVIRSQQAFKTSEAKIRVSIKSIGQAEEALRIIDDRYKFGLTTFNEVLRANSALIRARQDLMTTRYEYYISFARLLLATGRLDDVSWFD